jgi:hypothetical protein
MSRILTNVDIRVYMHTCVIMYVYSPCIFIKIFRCSSKVRAVKPTEHRYVNVVKIIHQHRQGLTLRFMYWNERLLARKSCDLRIPSKFSEVFLTFRTNAVLEPNFHDALHASHGALPLLTTNFHPNAIRPTLILSRVLVNNNRGSGSDERAYLLLIPPVVNT